MSLKQFFAFQSYLFLIIIAHCLPIIITSLLISILFRKFFGCVLIGVTGGIATGKSSFTNIMYLLFETNESRDKNSFIIDFDSLAHDSMACGTPVWSRLRKKYGDEILKDDQTVDRQKLARIVFNDSVQRRWLSKTMKVSIMKRFLQSWLVNTFYYKKRLQFLDCPLLFEAKLNQLCSESIVVACSEENQLKRLMCRDSIEELYAKTKIKSQMPISLKIKSASTVFINDSSLDKLKSLISDQFETRVVRFGKLKYSMRYYWYWNCLDNANMSNSENENIYNRINCELPFFIPTVPSFLLSFCVVIVSKMFFCLIF